MRLKFQWIKENLVAWCLSLGSSSGEGQVDLGGSGDEIRTLTSLAEFWVTYLSFGCFSNTQPEEQKKSKNYEKRLQFQAESTSAQTN